MKLRSDNLRGFLPEQLPGTLPGALPGAAAAQTRRFGFIGSFSQWWQGVDRVILSALTAILLFGILLIFAASPAVATRIGLDQYYFVIHHVALLIPSLGIIYVLSWLSPRQVRLVALALLPVFIALTYATLVVGSQIKGATRWVHVPGINIQPSEFLKPVFAVVSAWLFAKAYDEAKFPGKLISAALYFVTVAGLLLQPDLGMTVVMTAIWFCQLFLVGIPLLYVGGLAATGVGGLGAAYLIFPHVSSRVDRFMNPAAGDTYQIDRSLEAFGNGGWLGTGPGQGVVKRMLPDAHADFIFSVSGEELGLVWSTVLMLLFLVIVLRGLWRAAQQRDLFVLLALSGLMTQFGLQAMINMGSALHLIPTKGMTLPFVSYGGSSLIALAIGMGFVLALTRRGATRLRITQPNSGPPAMPD